MDEPYDDELREINRKTKQVYIKKGIYPFLDENINGNGLTGEIPGFSIFRLYDWDYYIEDDEGGT